MTQSNGLVVILATFNGGEVLRRTLEGYVGQVAPQQAWRLIVANNNSTDNTSQILEEFRSRLPLEVVFVEKPGKNSALNEALALIFEHDELVVFTDDDAIPHPGFLRAWEIANVTHKDTDLFAGRVVPLFLDGQPAWLETFKQHFDVLYAANDREEGLIEARNIFGPNMGVRKAVFRSGHRFDENIGPNSGDKNYPMGSETEFCMRAEREQKLTSRFIAEAAVDHQIRPKQTELEFIAGRAFRHGLGFAQQNRNSLSRAFMIKSFFRVVFLKICVILGLKKALWDYNWYRGLLSFKPQSGKPI